MKMLSQIVLTNEVILWGEYVIRECKPYSSFNGSPMRELNIRKLCFKSLKCTSYFISFTHKL